MRGAGGLAHAPLGPMPARARAACVLAAGGAVLLVLIDRLARRLKSNSMASGSSATGESCSTTSRCGLCRANGSGSAARTAQEDHAAAGGGRLARPAAGEVRLDGQPCRSEADFRRARPSIGFLFQEFDDQLFSPTVIEDVAFGPLNQGLSRSGAFARARRQLDAFSLAALADRPVQRLSAGEKRLACLAGLSSPWTPGSCSWTNRRTGSTPPPRIGC